LLKLLPRCDEDSRVAQKVGSGHLQARGVLTRDTDTPLLACRPPWVGTSPNADAALI
jgi:hypothetical protein